MQSECKYSELLYYPGILTKFMPKANRSVYSIVKRPHIPLYLRSLINPERSNKAFYNILTRTSLEQMKDKHEVKWSFVFKKKLSEDIWRNIYRSCFEAIIDNFLHGSNIKPFTEFLEHMAI